MKRRTFIGNVLAMIAAALAVPRIPKPAPDPDITVFSPIYQPPSTFIACRGAMDFNVGDPVYWDPKNGCLKKWDRKHPVIGYVLQKDINLLNGEVAMEIRGIDL